MAMQQTIPIILDGARPVSADLAQLIHEGLVCVLDKVNDNLNNTPYLHYIDDALTLHWPLSSQPLSLSIDFVAGKSKHRRLYGGGKKQPLAKACGLEKHPTWHVFDATAGLGKDSFVLASLGANITLCEQHAALFALLVDARDRGLHDDGSAPILKRMGFVRAHSGHYLAAVHSKQKPRPDVIYLDPMYPERKKAAKIKKEMQVLQQLVGHDDDTASLFELAVKTAVHRVVVKRPKSAKLLTALLPSYTVASVNTRYDVYVVES